MFILLEHRAPDGLHWDFMIELAGQETLATWRLAANPIGQAGAIDAKRIGDHRRAYLEFEGDIGQGRGVVQRIDRGESQVRAEQDSGFLTELHGARLRGRFELLPNADGVWMFRRAAPAERQSE